jgi:glycosyltransferase involved in cell wall biosynthesis
VKVLLVHNSYLLRGGEDSVVEAEIALLRSRGHDLRIYARRNDEISPGLNHTVAQQTVWSSRTTRDIADLAHTFRPDVIHAHNTFPLISPSLYWAAAKVGAPVVQTLHNFRLMCLNGLFLRNNRVCEDCLGRTPWRGVLRKCYRDSALASGALAGMLTFHRAIGTYREKVARYIALNEFCRSKFVEAGLPAARVVVKPNFIDLPPPEVRQRSGLLFVGRLSEEKGIGTLLKASSDVASGSVRIAGEGPEAGAVNAAPNIVPLGTLRACAVLDEMRSAVALVMPSVWYENFPRTIVEAYASGLPVIASRIGALAELVSEGETGLLFRPGDSGDLAEKMAWALANPDLMAEMGRRARRQYDANFSADVNYRRLMEIYKEAIEEMPASRT